MSDRPPEESPPEQLPRRPLVKPPGMSWESFADAIVSKAMREGEFSKLSGAGKPIRGLDEPYCEDWWLSSYLKREELALPCEALSLRAEVEQGLARIIKLPSEMSVRREVDRLNAQIAKVNSTVTSGPSTSIGKLHIEQIVQRWRAARGVANRKV